MARQIHKHGWTTVAVVAALAIFFAASAVEAATIQLPKGTQIKLKFSPGMKITSGDLSKEVPLLCYTTEAVEIGGKTIIEEGAQATARVVEVEPAKRGGKPGYIKVAFEELDFKGAYRSLDGAKIKLSGDIDHKGKGKKTLSYLFIFGLFIKGGQGVIPADAVYTAEVAESVILESK